MNTSIGYHTPKPTVLGPLAIGLVFVLVTMLPQWVGHEALLPNLGLIFTQYFSMTRRHRVPGPVFFCVGLVQDLVSGGPFGLNACFLAGLNHLIVTYRKVIFLGSPMFTTMLLTLVVAAHAIASLLLIRFVVGGWVDLLPLILQGLATLIFFPICNWAFGLLNWRILR